MQQTVKDNNKSGRIPKPDNQIISSQFFCPLSQQVQSNQHPQRFNSPTTNHQFSNLSENIRIKRVKAVSMNLFQPFKDAQIRSRKKKYSILRQSMHSNHRETIKKQIKKFTGGSRQRFKIKQRPFFTQKTTIQPLKSQKSISFIYNFSNQNGPPFSKISPGLSAYIRRKQIKQLSRSCEKAKHKFNKLIGNVYRKSAVINIQKQKNILQIKLYDFFIEKMQNILSNKQDYRSNSLSASLSYCQSPMKKSDLDTEAEAEELRHDQYGIL